MATLTNQIHASLQGTLVPDTADLLEVQMTNEYGHAEKRVIHLHTNHEQTHFLWGCHGREIVVHGTIHPAMIYSHYDLTMAVEVIDDPTARGEDEGDGN